MPTSKAVGRDYSNCRFRTLLTNLPPGIQHMLDRALDSFGRDVNVLPRWKEPVATGDGSVLENQFFPHASNDICCADGAGFILYQSGVVDFGHDKDLFKSRIKGAIHWAHYYWPHEQNTDICSLEEEIPNTKDIREIDFRDWLPGDYFLYFDKGKKDTAGHINVYLGPFVEVVDGQDITNPTFVMFNSSIGTTGGNEFCTPGTFAGHLAYCRSVGRSIFRCRAKAIEKLFRGVIGVPIQLKDEPPGPKDPPRAEIAWKLAAKAEAPYPVGRSLTWHDGIHLIGGEAVKSEIVECFAPGELVLARFGKDRKNDHGSLIVMRHRFLPSQVRLLGPVPVDGTADDPDAGSAEWAYSLYAQLAPISTYVVDGTEISPGIPELYGQQAKPGELPAGKAVAPPWLLRLWPRPKPALIKIVPDTAKLSLLALSKTASDAKPKLRAIAQPEQLTARRHYPLSELESVTLDGTKYWIVPPPDEDTNAEVWDGKIPPATVPGGKKLSYFNPHSGRALETPLRLAASTILVHEENGGEAKLVRVVDESGAPVTGSGGTLVRIVGHDQPGVTMSSFVNSPDEKKDQYDFDESTQILTFTANAKRIPVYTDTNGEGDKRYFADESMFDLGKVPDEREFKVRERAETGPRTKTARAWLDLSAGVWMSDAEIAKAEEGLAKRDTVVLEEIAGRLKNKRSALVGVKTKGSGWEMVDNALAASAQVPESGVVTIYCKIDGSGLNRKFAEPPAKQEAEQEHNLTLEIPPPSGAAIWPLLKPQGRVQTAVFELVFAATEEGTNQAEIDQVERENKSREPLAKKLLKGDLVDLRSEGQLGQAERNVPREPIAHLGDVAAPVAAAASQTVRGVHFEIFAGKNLVDASVAGSDGSIAPIGKTPWAVWKDGSSDGFFSKDFVNRLVEVLRKQQDQHWLALEDLDRAFGEDNVIQPEEWIAFCVNAKNQRTLSRLITVHKPEWMIDWAQQVKSSATRGIHTAEQEKQELSQQSETVNWGQGMSLEGVSGDAFFYHPLRFIEWLNTGLDFAVGGVSGNRKPRVKVKPLEGGDEVQLAPDSKDPGLFRYRTFAGEGAKDEAPVRVTLEEVDTATPQFTVLVKRGEVHTIRLIQPRVRRELQNVNDSLADEYSAPVNQGDARGGGWLLADGNAALQSSGYSRVTVMYTVEYNVRIPGTVSLQLAGDAGFKVTRVEVAGAQTASPPQPANSVSLTLKDDTRITAAVADSVVRGAKAFTITVDVTGATRKLDSTATLTATFSGGDLTSEKKEAVTVRTRTLAYKKGLDRGEDIAKLQLYLSQLFAADDLPCYRDVGKGEYTGPDLKAALVDGSYGKSLARALWRFIYTFGTEKDFAAWPVAVKTAKGADGTAATKDQITSTPPSVIQGAPPTKAIDPADGPADLYAKRVGGYEKGDYNHFPVVDAPLILEITKRFRPPFVLPHLAVFFETVTIPANLAGVTVIDGLNKDGNIGKSTILPMKGDSIPIRIEWQHADAQRDGDLLITLELPEKSAYRFGGVSPSTTMSITLKQMLAKKDLTLVSSGAVSTDPKDNLMTVRAPDHRIIGQRQLHGSRDLLKAQGGDACRDAAWAQYWLAAISVRDTAKPGGPIYKNLQTVSKQQVMVIDGKWNAKCVEAFKAFQDRYVQASMDLPALLDELQREAAKPG